LGDRIATLTKTDPSTGNTVDAESYVRDPNDNVISQTLNGTSTTFAYDRNRLQTAVTGGTTSSYDYDPFGRLDTITSGGQLVQRYTIGEQFSVLGDQIRRTNLTGSCHRSLVTVSLHVQQLSM
jgi:YD repeat-containing protein